MAKRKFRKKNSIPSSPPEKVGHANTRKTFQPRTWEEVETHGVSETHAFKTTKSDLHEKYPPPEGRNHPTFLARWNEFITDVASRPNFKIGHLNQLVVLCDLFVEYDVLNTLLSQQGYSFFSSGGRNGPQLKIRPEVSQINKTRSEIRSYCKALGLLLVKDAKFGSQEGEDEDDW